MKSVHWAKTGYEPVMVMSDKCADVTRLQDAVYMR